MYRTRGIVVRFIIGHTKLAADEAALGAEEREFGGFLRLPIEGYTSLPSKTVSFLKLATRLFTPEYVVKIDDDVYLRIDSLILATQQWKQRHADYIGCMKNGDVYSDPAMRWFERQWPLLGKTYFTHAWGTLYVLSGKVAAHLSSVPDGLLRFFGNEGE
ncbi:hypothetical protein WJX75_003351 [Coccomyxa subellipsoidea]|uniref:Hexosyltransferase n=1 Tax=Coccomyxa subellipsoidea TaxID=248742 RepID=A0ABR2YR42_9CHLO